MADLQISINSNSESISAKIKRTSTSSKVSIIPTGVSGPKGESGSTGAIGASGADGTGITSNQAAAININSSKQGITSSQVNQINANNLKNSYPTADSNKLGLITIDSAIDLNNLIGLNNLVSSNDTDVSIISDKNIILKIDNDNDETDKKWSFINNNTEVSFINESGDYSGKANTATTLATARNIGGVSFNGSSAINLPGVNTSGNQNTSGNAATSTKISSINNNDIVQLSGSQTLTGTKTFNSFKGTGSVTVTDIKDTDNFSDASSTSLATSESIKAYVDGAVSVNTDTQDLSISGQTLSLTNGGSVTLPSAGSSYTDTDAVAAVVASDLDMGGNRVLFANLYANTTDLPNAATYHGMFAHVHATGLAYYAHGGNWISLAKTSEVVVTNLAITGSTGARTITSSDGTDAVIPLATTSVSGLLSPGLFDEIDANTAKTSFPGFTTITETDVTITSATSSKPLFNLKSTTNDNKGSTIQFTSDKGGVGADDDIIGTIDFIGDNVGQTQTLFGKIQTRVETAANGDEAGKMRFMVSQSNSTTAANTTGLELIGHGTNSTISASIGHGAASLTTIAGDLKVTGNEIQDSGGNVVVSSNGSGVGQFTGSLSGNAGTVTSIGNLTGDVTSSNRTTTIANDAVTYAKMQDVSATNVVLGRDSAGAGVVEEISAANLRTIINVENGATADQSKSDIDGLAITTVGTLDTGNATAVVTDASTSAKGKASFSSDNFAVSSGAVTIKDGGVDLTAEVTGVLPSANLDADTAHLTTDQTFTGQKQINIRKFPVSSGTDGNAIGDVAYFGGTTSMTKGKIYHYKSDGTWEIANADAIATSDGLLAVALGAASDTNGMLLRGMVTLDHDPGAVGDVLYVQSDNAGVPGEATATAPSATGDCVRIVGYCVHASAGNIWFNPDNTFVEHA